jgi:hypothetical protein
VMGPLKPIWVFVEHIYGRSKNGLSARVVRLRCVIVVVEEMRKSCHKKDRGVPVIVRLTPVKGTTS